MSGWGAAVCEAWWGDNNRSEGWGHVYPICSLVSVDRTDIKCDSGDVTCDEQ